MCSRKCIGFSTKIYVAVDGEGELAKLHLMKGQRHDLMCAKILLEDLGHLVSTVASSFCPTRQATNEKKYSGRRFLAWQ
jgi:hypothetical protein